MAKPDFESIGEFVTAALRNLADGFDLPEGTAHATLGAGRLKDVLAETAARMEDNYPYFHPLYAGQMLKPPHPVAHAAYAMAMAVNPNNHARDGGRASSAMELESVKEIAGMFGWTEFLGHLTSGGTFANLEALWVAGQTLPGRRIAASSQAHYTHSRISAVLGLECKEIPVDSHGRMDVAALEARLQQDNIGTVVVTLGTTALGAVDPLADVLALRDRYGFRIHVDAAYGGYFTLAQNLGTETQRHFEAAGKADSIVIDPHKHGLQPYGCGCVLFRDPAVGRLYKHDSPYTYFTSTELHLGEISLECSRAGASAVALWATQRLLPLVPGGEFAQGLEAGRKAALELHRRLQVSPYAIAPLQPELDIVVWALHGKTLEESSARARITFEHAALQNLHLALVQIPTNLFRENTWNDSDAQGSTRVVTCLRSVLMKPEHNLWMDAIWSRLQSAMSASAANVGQ
jgi:glutamate/tyrosine decarboxylase-like PLP-dependent enzyme